MSDYLLHLAALSDVLMRKKKLTDIQQAALLTFLSSAISNRELSKEILANIKHIQSDQNIHADALAAIILLSFHTRNLNELKAMFTRIGSSYQKLKQGSVLNDDEKMSIREFAILHSLAALAPLFTLFNEHTFIQGHAPLHQLAEQVQHCHQLYSFIDSQMQSQTKATVLFGRSTQVTKADTLKEFAERLKTLVKSDPIHPYRTTAKKR